MIEFPKSTKVDKFIPKNKFYDGVRITPAVKNAFQSDVARVTWAFKLGPDTLSISKKNWPEIEIIRVEMKKTNYNPGILQAIDTAIPYPILFIVTKGELAKFVISYKEPNRKDENYAKVDTMFETEWNDPLLDNLKIDGLTTDTIYANFLSQVGGEKLAPNNHTDGSEPKTSLEGAKDDIEKMKERAKIQKQIDALTRKIKSEPSIGKRQELAEERYGLKQLYQTLV